MSKTSTHPKLRLAGRILLGLLVGMVVLIGGALLFLQSNTGGEFLRTQIESGANGVLLGELKIGSLKGSVWSELVLEDVALRDSEGDLVAQVGRVTTGVSILPILARDVMVDELRVEDAKVFVRLREDGILNVMTLVEPSEEESAPLDLKVILKAIELVDVDVVYVDEKVVEERLEEAPAYMSLIREGLSGEREFEAPGGIVVLQDSKASLTATLDLGASTTRVEATSLRAALGVDGVVERPFEGDGIDVVIADAINLTLARLAIAEEIEIKTIRASYDTASEKIDAGIDEIKVLKGSEVLARFSGMDLLEDLLLSAKAKGTLKDLSTELNAKGETAGALGLTAQLVDVLDSKNAKITGVLEMTELQAAKLVSPLPLESLVNGKLDLSVNGLEPETLEASGRLQLRNSKVDAYVIRSSDLNVIWKEGRITLEESTLDTPYAVAKATGAFSLGGDLQLQATLTSGEEIGQLSKVFKSDTSVDGKVDLTGKLDLEAEPGIGMVQNLSGTAEWNLSNFAMGDVFIKRSTGDFQIKVSSPQEDARDIAVKGDAYVSSSNVKDIRVGTMRADVDVETRVFAPYATLDQLLNRARMQVDVHITGLNGAGVRIDDSKVNASLRETSRNQYVWQLDTTNRAVRTSAVQLDQANAKLAGTMGLNPGRSGVGILRTLGVKGNVSGDALSAGTTKVGRLQATIDVAGAVQDLRGNVDFEVDDLPVGGTPESPLYDFETLKGNLALTGSRKFDVVVDGVQKPERTPETLRLNLRGTYAPTLDDFEIEEVQVAPNGMGWLIENAFSLDTKRGIYSFDNVTLSQGDQRIKVNGQLRLGKDQDVQASIENFRIEEMPKQFGLQDFPPVRGVVNGTLSAKGEAKTPVLAVDLVISDLYWESFGPFTITIKGGYQDESLAIASLVFEGYGQTLASASGHVPVRLDMNGRFEPLWKSAFDMTVKVHTQELATIVDILPELAMYSLEGRAGGDIHFRGLLEKPELDAKFELDDAAVVVPQQGDDISLGPMKLRASLTYREASQEDLGLRAELEILDDNNEGMRLQAYSALPVPALVKFALGDGGTVQQLRRQILDSALRLNAQVLDYDITKVNFSELKRAKAEGKFEFQAMVDGTIGDPNAGVFVRLKGFGWDRFRDIELDIEAGLSQEMLEVSKVRVEWDADEVFTGTARVPFPVRYLFGEQGLEDLPIRAKFNIPTLPVAKLSAMDYTFANIRGTMQASLEVQGSLSSPELAMELGIKDTLFSDRQTGDVKLDIRAAFGRAALNMVVSHGENKSAVIVGDVPVKTNLLELMAGESPLDEGDLSLLIKANKTPLASLIPARIFDRSVSNVSGELTSDFSIGGSWDALVSKGSFELRDLNAFFPGFGRNVEKGQLRVVAHTDRIDIEELSISESNSSIEAEGRVNLQNLRPTSVRMSATMEDLATTGFTPMPVYVSGNVELDADLTSELVEAKIGVRELSLDVVEGDAAAAHPLALSSDVVILNRVEQESGMTIIKNLASLTAGGNALAKVQVTIAPNSVLRHPNATVRFQGDLALELRDGDTVIFGDIRSSTGEVEFLGKNFRVDQGIISFTGASPPNPRLQVEASYKLDRSVTEAVGPATSGDPRAVVRVSGTALRPVLRMSSDPQMTESQIIYVLVSDRPPTDTSGQEEGVASQAVAAASGLLSGMLKDRAKGFYPVDMLRLRTDETGISGVEVGKYFGKNLFFAYEYVFGADEGENTNEVRLEYQITSRWLVGTRFGDQANGALFLYWDIF